MGIPKLMQDLSSYTERVFLGRQNDGNMALSVLSIVIDGPSLVYHVYERIMGSLPDLQQSLTYRDINVTVVQVLDEIRSHGVDMYGRWFLKMSQLTGSTARRSISMALFQSPNVKRVCGDLSDTDSSLKNITDHASRRI